MFKNMSQKNYIIIGVFGMLIGIITTIMMQKFIFANELSSSKQRQNPELKKELLSSKENLFGFDHFETLRKMQDRMIKDFEDIHNFGESFLNFDNNRLKFMGSAEKYYTINRSENNKNVIYEITLEEAVEGGTVDVTVENGLVNITGKKSETKSEDSERKDLYYSSTSTFSQSFSVPEDVNANDVKIENEGNKIILTFEKKSQVSSLTKESEYSL